MADKGWKAFERRLARRFGTQRIPAAGVMGHQQTDAPDFETSRLAVQVKKGYKQPAYLREWLEGIARTAGRKVPLVLWGANRAKDDDVLVLLTVKDMTKLMNGGLEPAEAYAMNERASFYLSHADRSVRDLALFVFGVTYVSNGVSNRSQTTTSGSELTHQSEE